ncbi:hypothetical protein RHO13_01590 [Orbus wheelerorum]|uniref:hypothetical protein n=1 Tax=Orbus wheelerorum TaxID=3074111 RepID=UPI00370D6D35
MFRILFVISVSAFILVGCGKKVTGDMLIGEWVCQYTLYQDPFVNRGINDMLPQGKTLPSPYLPSPYKMTYIKDDIDIKDNILIKATKNDNMPVNLMDSVFTKGDGSYEETAPNSQIIVSRGQFIFVSDDSYKLSEISAIDNIEVKSVIENIGVKKESLCTRVK